MLAPDTSTAGASAAERELLVAEVRRFAGRHVDGNAIERAGRVPDEVVAGLRDLGAFGIALPAEHGGSGLGVGDACAVVEELARWDRSVATMVGLHSGLGTRGIVSLARPDVAAAWLPRLASGECIGAFAATEACAGSDLMAMRTTARFEGDEIVLDGEKSYVTNGRFAGCYTVVARTGARGHALVLVPRGTPGVAIGPEEHKLGIRASSTVTLSFTNVRVPASHLLGSAEGGLDEAYAVLSWGRTVLASGCVGTMQAALDATAQHVATRRQFRRTLGEFPAVRTRVAGMAAMLFAARAVTREAAEAIDRGAPSDHPSMVAKIFASDRTFEVCDAAVQLHGALGVLEDVGVARLLRDCRVTRIFEGANDVLLLRIAAARLTKREAAPRVGTASSHADGCDAVGALLDAAADVLRTRYGAAVVAKQGVLLHLGRAEVAHAAAVASARAAGTRDSDADLADLAVRRLLGEARAELDALAGCIDVDRISARVAERLYGAPPKDRPQAFARPEERP